MREGNNMWIESHQSLLTHRKTARMARSLAIGKITVIGHLHAFWWWCMDNAPEGNITNIDIEDIADGAVWEGEPKAFLDALVFAGFVDSDDSGIHIHKWHDYAGKLIDRSNLGKVRARDRRYFQQRVYLRDNHTCVYCGSTADLTIDHVIPLTRGGQSTLDNLSTSCRSCNSSKNDRTLEEWKN